MSEDDPTPTRAGAGRVGASRRDYLGCGALGLGFLLLVIVSFTVGVILRPDAPGIDEFTLTSGGSGDSGWRLVAYLDEDGDQCLRLDVDGTEATGQCGTAVDTTAGAEAGRYLITSSLLPDGTTIAFAPVPRQAATVVLPLDDGTEATAEVRVSETTDIRWFVTETEQAIDGPAQILDDAGEALTPG